MDSGILSMSLHGYFCFSGCRSGAYDWRRGVSLIAASLPPPAALVVRKQAQDGPEKGAAAGSVPLMGAALRPCNYTRLQAMRMPRCAVLSWVVGCQWFSDCLSWCPVAHVSLSQDATQPGAEKMTSGPV